ncbi:hypothetical protein N5923_09235 [Erwiniaceae bacterium BAC15a-03b]|uniref:Uncharacterized protein n=1 Tax=Winslowiella arboricola TaxID=2978220 RepID=A0A9J6PMM7_9GAMM|nr:hypothetical protein [Winslowiella arboricola]MCU5773765.1 hypothetical protein [Winslowiella arboricola]MCU5777675.1 hypothetical protein [Winslowiella arboricola]
MLNNINIIIRRCEQRVLGKEHARQKVQISAENTGAEIADAQQQRQLLQQHLASLTIAGETTLHAILENKAHQGTLQRRLADIDLLLADRHQQLEELTKQHSDLEVQRNILQRKVDKITSQLQRRRKQQQQGRQRQYEAETEEQLNWQM